eukprot:6540962-Pyramimonas_sp.AAC.2
MASRGDLPQHPPSLVPASHASSVRPSPSTAQVVMPTVGADVAFGLGCQPGLAPDTVCPPSDPKGFSAFNGDARGSRPSIDRFIKHSSGQP